MEQLASVTTSISRWIYRRNDNDNDARPLEPSSLSSPGQEGFSHHAIVVENECRNEFCRYCHALERSLRWEGYYTTLVNIYVLVLFNVVVWIYNGLRMPIGMPQIPFGITVYLIIQMVLIWKLINTLAPAEEHTRLCSTLHFAWKRLRQLRNEQREIYSFFLCTVAFGLWLFGRVTSSSSRNTICWSIIFAAPVLRLPLKVSEMITMYFKSHGDWRNDSDIDEFLPVVTEANLQVLNRVGETGDRSPTPTSALWDDFNGSLNDEDLVEGLNIPSYEDGVELSELELSVSENDTEENNIKFQTRHFEKSSSSSSDDEIFDSNDIIAVSSDGNNSDSDFEIIDMEEVEKIKI